MTAVRQGDQVRLLTQKGYGQVGVVAYVDERCDRYREVVIAVDLTRSGTRVMVAVGGCERYVPRVNPALAARVHALSTAALGANRSEE